MIVVERALCSAHYPTHMNVLVFSSRNSPSSLATRELLGLSTQSSFIDLLSFLPTIQVCCGFL